MKIIDNLKDGYEILKENNISSYKIDCEILMSKTLNISREEVLLNLEKNVKKEEKERYFNLINRRKKNEPIAYITNNKSFWKNKFITNCGNGAIYFGWLGTLIGLIALTAGKWDNWGDIEKTGLALSVAMLTLLYGYIIKLITLVFRN